MAYPRGSDGTAPSHHKLKTNVAENIFLTKVIPKYVYSNFYHNPKHCGSSGKIKNLSDG